MVRFSPKDAETLFNRVAGSVLRDRKCRTCGKMFRPASSGQQHCDKDRPKSHLTLDCLDPPKRKRGGRGRNRTGAGDDPPIDDGPGKLNYCPICKTNYANAVRRYTQCQGKVEFDYFKCRCKPSHEYTRYR